jgi:multicomponent Na+:H+ antiporter subunit E
MTTVLLVAILALLWAAITGNFSGLNLLFGAMIAGVPVLLLRNKVVSKGLLRRSLRAGSLLLLFLRELMISAFRVAVLVLRPDMSAHIRPGIVGVPLTVRSDAEITLLANMITLTPGTVSVDVSDDRKTLYVHALVITDRQALIDEIKNGFERKVREVFE